QVVILGDNQVGFTHPNKIYVSMFIGKPILYIGPPVSHVTDIIQRQPGNIAVRQGDVKALVEELEGFAAKGPAAWLKTGLDNRDLANREFHPDSLKEQMCAIVSGAD